MSRIDIGFNDIEYSGAYAGVGIPARGTTGLGPALEQRRQVHSGEPLAPHIARLNGLPPRTVADWSGHVSGCACPYDTRLPDGKGGTEVIWHGAFKHDHDVEVPILLLHDFDQHIGWARLDHRRTGLYFTGQLRRGATRTIGNWRGISLGFATMTEPDNPNRRHYHAMALEVSVCERGAYHPHSYLEVLDEATLAA